MCEPRVPQRVVDCVHEAVVGDVVDLLYKELIDVEEASALNSRAVNAAVLLATAVVEALCEPVALSSLLFKLFFAHSGPVGACQRVVIVVLSWDQIKGFVVLLLQQEHYGAY